MHAMFDLHRSFVEQQLEFTRDSLEAQQELFSVVGESFESIRDLSEQQTALIHAAVSRSIENLPAELEGTEELEGIIEESFVQLETASDTSFDASASTFEESTDAYQRFVEAYLEALESGIDAYLEATENVEEAAQSVATEIDVE